MDEVSLCDSMGQPYTGKNYFQMPRKTFSWGGFTEVCMKYASLRCEKQSWMVTCYLLVEGNSLLTNSEEAWRRSRIWWNFPLPYLMVVIPHYFWLESHSQLTWKQPVSWVFSFFVLWYMCFFLLKLVTTTKLNRFSLKSTKLNWWIVCG